MATPADKVHRLTDMQVEEVSLVDRAANKRKWLVVKRDSVTDAKGSNDMAAGSEISTDGKGGLTTKGKPPPGAKPGDEKKKPPMAKADLPPGFKEMMGPLLEKASERLSSLADMINGATSAELNEDGSMPGVPEEVQSEFGAVVGLLQQAMNNFPKGAAPADGEEGADDGSLDDEPPEEMTMAAKAIVQKLGAKMSKERLNRFAQAMNVLGSIFTELQGQQGGTGEGAPAPAPAGKGKGKEEPSEKDKTKKSDSAPDPVVAALERVTKAVHQTTTRLDRIESGRGSGNSLPVDGAGTPVRKGSDEVSWPLDMNAPMTRDTVEKSVSFFDND